MTKELVEIEVSLKIKEGEMSLRDIVISTATGEIEVTIEELRELSSKIESTLIRLENLKAEI